MLSPRAERKLMDDFDTVRANPLNYESLRALDRIQAEVEQLQAMLERQTRRLERRTAERDSLRADTEKEPA